MRINASVIAIAAASTAICSTTQASLTIDFRLPDGSKSINYAPGDLTPVTIQAWAIVVGGAGNSAPEGLQSAVFAAKSYVSIGSGFAGGISSGVLTTGWAGSGSKAGLSNNISNDGIGDWGNVNNTPLTLSANFFRIRTTKGVNNAVDWGDNDSPAGSIYNPLADGGKEFLVGNFTWTPTNTAPGGIVTYAPVAPLGGTVVVAGWFEDTADKTAPSPTGASAPSLGDIYTPLTPNASASNGVTISYIPEPTSIGLLGLSGVMVIRRTRKTRA